MIRVFLADERPVVLAGLRAFFRRTEFQVVGEAATGAELTQNLEPACPHLLLIDPSQSVFREFAASYQASIARKKRWPYQIVDVSGDLKNATRSEFLESLRRFAARFSHLKKELAKSSPFTFRENEVLSLIVQGCSNKEIASTLGLALDTVKKYVHSILRKTSLADRTQAALWAVREGIVLD